VQVRNLTGNKKPHLTKFQDVNRAFQDIYDITNKLIDAVNSSTLPHESFKGSRGDIRINDDGFQYHDGRAWQKIASGTPGNDQAALNLGIDLPSIPPNTIYQASSNGRMASSLLQYPSADGDANLPMATNGSGVISFSNSLALRSLSVTSPTSGDPDLIINNTGDTAFGANLIFKKGSGAAGEDGDGLGNIFFQGYNDAGTPELITYAGIVSQLHDATDGQESGKITLQVANHDGGVESGLMITGGSADGEVDVTIGNGSSSVTTIAGNLDIDGSKQTSAGNFEVETTGHFVVDSGNDIILDSNSGNFIAMKAGTEFSAANSAYAGMILGYTVIGDNATPASFDVTNAMLPVHDDLKVSFVFPPSGKVEIMASIYVQTDGARPLTFGLSTTDASTGFTSLGAKYENHTFMSDETDGYQHSHRWYITGTAGDSEELWFAVGCTHTNRYDLFWGGDSSSVADSSHPMEYQPFIMKATALPATVYVG
tara:strand:+ start:2198 stop:3649 length:1452 start_codon:yes stop_codon:yes gene_type:complete